MMEVFKIGDRQVTRDEWILSTLMGFQVRIAALEEKLKKHLAARTEQEVIDESTPNG